MKERDLRFAADGVEMTGLLVDGCRGTSARGVLVAHELSGRDPRVIEWARKLAQRGYVALALDLYGAPFSLEESIARHDAMMAMPGLVLARATAALGTLSALLNLDRARLAASGFCQGGIVVGEFARAGAPI